jgi:YebC/PmpR family DNA-binding regulatory protein
MQLTIDDGQVTNWMAGHSHWAKIKRAKGANDKKRGRIWSKIARKIILAAKNGGDPRDNLTLRYVIEEAKGSNMPRDTIEKAIKKGTGELGAENYEAATYEGYGPNGVALMIDALTNNRARTAAELRRIFEVNGGNFAVAGSVSFQFTKRGVITIKSEAVSEEKLIDLSLEAGAEDVTNLGEVCEVLASPTLFHKVRDAIGAAGITFEAAEITQLPNSTVAVDVETAHRVLKLIDDLEENEDVQSVSHNAELPESVTV